MDGPSTLPDATGAVHWGGLSKMLGERRGERARVHWAAPQIMLVHILVGIQGVQCIGRPLIILSGGVSTLEFCGPVHWAAPHPSALGDPSSLVQGSTLPCGPVHWAAPYCA